MFHVHPDDADWIFNFIKQAVSIYNGNTKWELGRQKNNRFILCPVQVALRAKEVGDFSNAVREVRKNFPKLELDAARDVILLSDFLCKTYMLKGDD